MEIYYVDILLAVITIALSKAAWKLIPQYSKLEPGQWEEYLKSSKSPKMLWPAQQLIGKKNVLSGENAIVQLPTGVGKTKSIELIIRSSFLSNRTATAIIVAPLRALCNEVASDMTSAFGESVLINQFSDILENDFFVDFTLKATILICTPEKLSYIIHHQVEFLDEIGLYIFDESHMFDDGRRGTAYELLISEIRKHINTEKQIVLLSAVLSNAEQIKQWLFNENGTLASDPAIKTTPKSIGFSSQTRDIHYYSEDPEREDFYVPRSIEVNLLKKLGKERKKRYFPNLTDPKDIAIYYANKLCKNGGAAIFANRTRSVQTIIQQIIDLDSREYDLSGIQKYSNTLEMSRIAKLMADYYGCDHPYTKACNLGVAPHYSNLPNGLRLAIEYAFRKKDLHLVICTSTLAQGVNIPIKYLFMTSFMLDQNSMKIRNFQNLMGRTARSGMYTEGSVIVTDSKLFDNKNNRSNGGFYKWENCVKMFDSHAAEPCESSILWLVQDIEINRDDYVKGVYIANYIINNYSHWDCFESCYEKILQAYERKKQTPMNQKSVTVLKTALTVRQHVVETIENHLCFVLSNDEGSDAQVVALELCKETLAYFMANDAEKTLLEKIFDVIAQKAKTVDDFDCGIMISASHNPYYDNGIKLIDCYGEKMPEEILLLVEDYIDGKLHVFDKDWPELPFAHREHIGCTVDYVAGRNRYMGYLISLGIYSFKGVKVGLDCANGSSWNIAKSVFDALGADTYVINAQPNGLNMSRRSASATASIMWWMASTPSKRASFVTAAELCRFSARSTPV